MLRAQLLIVPLLFFACSHESDTDVIQYADTTVTMSSYDHVMIYSGNGLKRSKMSAPEIRRYEYSSNPRTEYPKGVKVYSYSDTSSSRIVADLSADYAILWERADMWEARGNIVAHNYVENKSVYTDVLFWDQTNGLIYNDHFTKVKDGDNWWTGYGFQTDEEFSRWRFTRSRGQMEVQRERADTTSSKTINADSIIIEEVKN